MTQPQSEWEKEFDEHSKLERDGGYQEWGLSNFQQEDIKSFISNLLQTEREKLKEGLIEEIEKMKIIDIRRAGQPYDYNQALEDIIKIIKEK